MLSADIVIRGGELSGRLELYEQGSACYPEGARFGAQLYRPGAFLPRGQPRPATPTEVAALDGRTRARDRNHTIGIVRLPAALVTALRQARAGEGRIADEALRRWPFDGLGAALAPGWAVSGELIALGYGHTPAGFLTVTFDAQAGRFIGLHIDDLDAMPLARREDSTTRLCVNLGDGARYLLFVNLGVARMAQMLAQAAGGDDFTRLRSTPLIHAFLRRFPAYPIVRLAILPGEAYIAPTENMIHDGSTAGMAHDDLQVTLRGLFDPA
jgi:hypothetical protein